MKKYEFTIRKVLEKKVEIDGENKKQAFEKVMNLLGLGEKILFDNIDKNNEVYEIKMNKISDKNNQNNIVNIGTILEEIIKKIEEDLQENKEEIDEDDEEIDEDLLIETDEIICEKCGNHIPLEEIL